jgi:hypothetical protein
MAGVGSTRPNWVLVSVALALALVACGGSGGSAPSPSRTSTSGRVAAAKRALCHDLVQIGGGAFRPRNLGRLIPKLNVDRHLLAAAGDTSLAASVHALQLAIVRLRAALQGHGNLGAANHRVLQALATMPNC